MEKAIIKNKGATLSEEQYDLVVSYLNTGRKPALDRLKKAKLYGKMNGAPGVKNCPGYFRFKAIVKRLDIRPSDGALVFKANGKVVLPNNQFRSTIMEAHTSAGYKHFGITATCAKKTPETIPSKSLYLTGQPQEKYTLGCRQFGISEEEVRAVIKECREGSCADKYSNRQGFSIMKNLVKPTCQQENKESKLNKAKTRNATPICPKVDKTDSHTTQQPASNEPAYALLEKLPNGNFVIKQIVMKQKDSTQQPMDLSSNAITPINNVAVMNHMPSLQLLNLMNIRANSTNIKVNANQAGMHSGENIAPQPLLQTTIGTAQFAIPINFNISKFQNLNINNLTNVMLTPMILKPKSNAIDSESSEKVDLATLDTKIMDCMSESVEKIRRDNDEEGTDSCDEDKDDEVTIVTDEQPMEVEDKSEDKTTIQFLGFWYNQADLKKEKDPFKKINLAIKDMRLDVLKSLRGHNASMDRLKSKIDVVTKMVDCYRVILNSNTKRNTDEANKSHS